VRRLGQDVGQDAEAVRVGHVADKHLAVVGVDVGPAADLVAQVVAPVGGDVARMSVPETGPTRLVLRVVLAGRHHWNGNGNWNDDPVGPWNGGGGRTRDRSGQQKNNLLEPETIHCPVLV